MTTQILRPRKYPKKPQLKSPIAWVGGKSKLTDTILPLIPPHQGYVEVFAGAAWVLFRKPISKGEIINDINGDLVNLYRIIQSKLPEFLELFKWTLVSREEFYRLKSIDRNTLTDIERAALFYYLVRNSFGAKITGTEFGVCTPHKPRLNLLTIEEELKAAHLRLSRVFIENLPYQRILERFDKPDTFFYIDPPYWDCENVYGKGLFSKEDFTTLRDMLIKCTGKWMMSINDVPQIRALFDGFHIKEVKTTYSITSGAPKPTTELLIANYAIN